MHNKCLNNNSYCKHLKRFKKLNFYEFEFMYSTASFTVEIFSASSSAISRSNSSSSAITSSTVSNESAPRSSTKDESL